MIRFPAKLPQIICKIEDRGPFRIFYNSAPAAGAWRVIAALKELERRYVTNYVLVTRGAVRYTPFDESFAPILLSAGDDNQQLPGWKKGQSFLIEAVSADAEFICVMRTDAAQFKRSVVRGIPDARALAAMDGPTLSIESNGFTILCEVA